MSERLSFAGTAREGLDGWTPREILLHLIGALDAIPREIKLALAGAEVPFTSDQRGGEYVDVAEIATAGHALTVLQEKLSAIETCVRGLSDAELDRTVKLPMAEEPPREVPLGLVVRHMVTNHLDEHVAQLQQALGSTAAAQASRGSQA